ncbi:MAG: general secretion pathway protein GspB [Gammaproteobacteria bacterium]|nr:general secretion pathway protein GspB [Gammaproteobacteria bacterium]
MSLILDALRKSERTRQQTLTGQVSAADAAHPRARVPVPWATLIGILLVANALVLTVIFWRAHAGGNQPLAASPQASPRAAPASPVPETAYRPQIRSLAVEAAAAGSPAKPAGTPAASVMPAASPANATATLRAPEVASTSPSTAAQDQLSTSAANDGNIPAFDTLPLAFQQSLPPLHMDVHSYSQDPAQRFVVINMQRYQTGDTLKEGPRVVAITPRGVVLEYDAQKFLLPRP